MSRFGLLDRECIAPLSRTERRLFSMKQGIRLVSPVGIDPVPWMRPRLRSELSHASGEAYENRGTLSGSVSWKGANAPPLPERDTPFLRPLVSAALEGVCVFRPRAGLRQLVDFLRSRAEVHGELLPAGGGLRV